MSKIIKNSCILMAITLVAGCLLGLVYEITKNPIAQSQARAKEEAFQSVFPAMASTEEIPEGTFPMEIKDEKGNVLGTIEEAYQAIDGDGVCQGLVINVTNSEGYGGNINFSLGIQREGTLLGVSVLSINETAGLGMKAKDAEFLNQYKDKAVDAFVYTKTGAAQENEIDAISGATITTNAVTNGVNAGILYFKQIQEGGLFNE